MSISDAARDLILQTLEARGISDRQCLMACGIKSSFLADWKSGKAKNPTFEKVYPIFQYLGLSLDDFGKSIEPVPPPVEMTEDEEELLRMYRMLDREGKTLVLSSAYGEKRRLAEQGSGVSSGERIS